MNEKSNCIIADLSNWKQHHSIALNQISEDIYTVNDLKKQDFHLISFINVELSIAKNITLNLCIKKTEECTTNFTIYLTRGICVAIIDMNNLQVLSGLAKDKNLVKFISEEEGWTALTVNIDLEEESPI